MTLREKLNKIDFDTDMKYDLVNLYEAKALTKEEEKRMDDMLDSGEYDADSIYDILIDDRESEYHDLGYDIRTGLKVDEYECPNCGEIVNKYDMFCPNCDRKLLDECADLDPDETLNEEYGDVRDNPIFDQMIDLDYDSDELPYNDDTYYPYSFTYQVGLWDLYADVLYDKMLDYNPELSKASDDEIHNYFISNYKDIIKKYYDDILDYYRESASEEAAENFDYDDYVDSYWDDDKYEASRDLQYESINNESNNVKYFKVSGATEGGDAESGPIVHEFSYFIKASDESEAKKIFNKEFDNDSVIDYHIEPATKEEYDSYIEDQKFFNIPDDYNSEDRIEESLKESFGDFSDDILNMEVTDDDRKKFRDTLTDMGAQVFDSMSEFNQELLVAENKDNGWFWSVYDGDSKMINLVKNLKSKLGYDESEALTEKFIYSEPIEGSIQEPGIGNLDIQLIDKYGNCFVFADYKDDKYGHIKLTGGSSFIDNNKINVKLNAMSRKTRPFTFSDEGFEKTFITTSDTWQQDLIEVVKEGCSKVFDEMKAKLDKTYEPKEVTESSKNLFKFKTLKENSNNYKLSYEGPIYRFGNYIGQTDKQYVKEGKSEAQAINFIIAAIKKDLGLSYNSNLTIDKHLIEILNDPTLEPIHDNGKCETCGRKLTDGSFCPYCDDGYDDLD